MFANIKNNQIIDINSKYLNKDIFRVEITDEIYQAWLIDKNKVIYKPETNTVILNPNYETQKAKELKEKEISKIKKEIAAVDLQRIRAIAEPSIKNNETNESWLEFYNSQIFNLRNKLKVLNEEK